MKRENIQDYRDDLYNEQNLLEFYEKKVLLDQIVKNSKKYEKANQQLENSKKLKIIKKISVFFRLSNRLKLAVKAQKLYDENIMLRAKCKQLEEIRVIKDSNYTQKTNNNFILEAKEEQQKAWIRTLNDQGELLSFIDKSVKDKQANDRLLSNMMKYSSQTTKNYSDRRIRRYLYQKMIGVFRSISLPEYLVRVAEQEKIDLSILDSFNNDLVRNERKKQLTDCLLPEQLLDNKWIAYQFVDQLHISRPLESKDTFSYKDIPLKEGLVIKPVEGAGSRGVYLLYNLAKIVDVRRAKILSSTEELISSMKNDLQINSVKEDRWYTETLVLQNKNSDQSAKDLKFYCFYGEVELVLEIERYPELRYCWWDRAGNRISTGKYENDLFVGEGVTELEIQQAERISAEIPTAFMRIDFLKTDKGLVFGEFTPKPGNFDEFNSLTDERLGCCYLRAETRLMNDLIEGKEFKYYQNIRHAHRRY